MSIDAPRLDRDGPAEMNAGRAPGRPPTPPDRRTALAAAIVAVLGLAAVGVIATRDDGAGSLTLTAPADSLVEQPDDVVEPIAEPGVKPAADGSLPDLEGQPAAEAAPVAAVEPAIPVESERADGGCTIGAQSLRLGSSGDGVTCLQQALIDAGFYDEAADGVFDDGVLRAARAYQESERLFVDGVIGRESAISLDIWPDEESFVVRTPPPAEGAMDSTGYLLSPVASVGAAAPPLPENSGSGRRVVYDRAGQRVWAVSGDGEIIRSWLVSGSQYNNEMPGTHTVYSKSEQSTAWNGKAWLPLMIRYQETRIGHIGFHSIPLHVEDNSPYQTTDELGTRLSGGCQRQHNLDAQFLWAFADIGTTVVVT